MDTATRQDEQTIDFEENEPKESVQPDETVDEIEVQHRESLAYQSGLVAKLQGQSPDKWKALLENRMEMLSTVRAACIAKTVPIDWTLFRGPDGDETASPRKSGCTRIKKIMGITVFNYRPKNANGDAYAEITDEVVKRGDRTETVKVATLIADGYCYFTGESIEDVRHEVRSDDPFTGRGTLQDLRQSCRTGLDSKVIRLLSDSVKVPVDVLAQHHIDVSKCYKGHGYGSSAGREAAKKSTPELQAAIQEFFDEVMARVSFEKEAAAQLLYECTTFKNREGKEIKGIRSFQQFGNTKRIDAAWRSLRAHSHFGDESLGLKNGAKASDEAKAEKAKGDTKGGAK